MSCDIYTMLLAVIGMLTVSVVATALIWKTLDKIAEWIDL